MLGTGILVLPAIAAATAGPASVLAWVALVVLSVPLALTYAALARQRPDAAGFAGAIERAFGREWGGVAGWIFLAQTPTGFVVAALIAGGSAAGAFGGGRDAAFLGGAALVLLAFGLNLVGLRVSATAQAVAVGIIALVIFVVIARAMPEVDPSAFSPFFPNGPAAVGVAAVQLFWAFVGWEAITPLAGEFRDRRDIWRASFLAVLVVGAFYVSLSVVTVGTRAYGESVVASAPLVSLATRSFGPSAGWIVGLGGFVLSFPVVNAYVAGITRLAAALARRRQLPGWLGELGPAGVPRRAILVLFSLAAIALAVAYLVRLGIADLLPLSTSSFIATYVLSMAAAVRLLRPPLRYAAASAFVACGLVLLLTGALLGWIAAVSLAALAYMRLSGRDYRIRKPPANGSSGAT